MPLLKPAAGGSGRGRVRCAGACAVGTRLIGDAVLAGPLVGARGLATRLTPVMNS